MPVYGAKDDLLMYQARCFGTGPKYFTKGQPESIDHILGENTAAPVLFVVEDLLSAIKISKVATVMPLWGSSISDERLVRLSRSYSTLVIVQEALPEIAKAAGVDAEQLKTCTSSPEAKELISRQAALGSSLNLQGTPAFFVNGKPAQGAQFIQVLDGFYHAIGGAPLTPAAPTVPAAQGTPAQ